METTSLIALSRAVTLQRQMDVVANNVANVNTTAFKGSSPLFTEYLIKPEDAKTPRQNYSMTQDSLTLRDTSAGAFTQTGNPLDIAIEGRAYFSVGTLNGTRYTRDGNLTLDANRQLSTASGLPVLDTSGNPITFPANASNIRISPEGTISSDAGIAGKIQLSDFQNEQAMTLLGHGLYDTTEPPTASTDSIVRQGFLEGSNVSAVREMTDMIEINREYQNIQKLLQNEHDRLRNAYAKLSKLA